MDPHESLIPKSFLDPVVPLLALGLKLQERPPFIAACNEKITAVFQNQQRIRENIKSLQKLRDSNLVKRYLKDLDKEEDDIISTRAFIKQYESESMQLTTEQQNLKLEATKEAEALHAAIPQAMPQPTFILYY